jgi:anaerobic magnesium-protoporphyrin IX monomethyl ester cyclase
MKLLLTTLHAKYVHASLALPCLAAACSAVAGVEAVIREYTVNEPSDRLLRRLLVEEADVVAFSCYIWNIETTLRLAEELKLLRPQTFIILGGPEVSYAAADILHRYPAVDCIIRGEGEGSFPELMTILASGTGRSGDRTSLGAIAGIAFRSQAAVVTTPDRPALARLDDIPSPFRLGLADRDKPLVYYETSRGCPFSCAFCMSALEPGVRSFSAERIRDDLLLLMEAEVATVKLVDRTFNYDAARANEIWAFINEHNRTSLFHFEIAAELLTDANLALLSRVPEGVFRFEIGVQSGTPATLDSVARRSDLPLLYANIRRLREETGVVVHLDLIAGLPGEDFDGFLASLAPLFKLSPHHIQVEPLKVLKGTPMRRIAAREGYLFSSHPPYKILQTPWLSFADICRIELISRLLDLVHNNGRFPTLLRAVRGTIPLHRFFADLAAYWDARELPQQLALAELFRLLWCYCETELPSEHRVLYGDAIRYDFCMTEYPSGRLPGFMDGALAGRDGGTGRDLIDTARSRLNLPAGSRIRAVAVRFAHDCLKPPFTPLSNTLSFLYLSVPGRRQEVRVIPR